MVSTGLWNHNEIFRFGEFINQRFTFYEHKIINEISAKDIMNN